MYIEKLESLISQNKDIFYKELKEVIKPSFDGLDNPSKYTNIVENFVTKSNRKPFARQARLISAASEYISKKNNKSLLVSSEMGTGKCILPHSQVVINGQVLSIEHAYELFADKTSQIIDDENFNASWFVPNTKLLVPSYCEKTRKIVDKEVKHIYKQKVSEEIRKVITDGNYSIDTTKVHKFLTPNGWTNKIKIGDYVAIPKKENLGQSKSPLNPSLLGWLLGEGYFGTSCKRVDGTRTGYYVSVVQKDQNVFHQIVEYAREEKAFTVKTRMSRDLYEMHLYKVDKLRELGIEWVVSEQKEIPKFLMKSDKDDIVKFIAAYFDAEGSVTNDNRGMIEISSASKMIVYQLSSLLRRLGVVSRIATTKKMATNGNRIMRTYYRLNISGSSARKFALEILPYSIVDYKRERLSNLCDIVINNNLETIYVYDLIAKLKEITGLSRAKSNNIFANVYINGQQKTVNDFTVFKIIKLIDDILSKELKIKKDIDEQLLINIKNELYSRLEQDIFFVKVKKIEEYNYDGYVYDLSVDTTHNFIAENMLVHNTDMGLKLSMADKFKVNFILCPPHLVDKWEDEIKVNYVDHKSFKVIKVNRWEDLIPYTKRDMRKDGIKYYFIISRETAKLGYPKQPAIKISFKQIIKEKMLDGESLMVKQLVKVARCPDCYSVLEEGNSEFIDTSTIPYKCECGAVLRSVDRTVSPKMQTRISIAEYVKRTWTKGAIDLLIVDEIHECATC